MKEKAGQKREIIINASAIAVLSVLASFCSLFIADGAGLAISYSLGKEIFISYSHVLTAIISAVILCGAYFALLTFLKRKGESEKISGKNLTFFLLLSALGVVAFLIISVILSDFGVAPWLSFELSALATLTYFLLIYKLYFEDKINSNEIFWEIFRFAIVGLVASVFDFAVAFSVQFFAFKNSTGWLVTALSTASGFLVGVAINYLLSTFMVYKASKSGFSKTFKGVLAFVVLSAVGLFLGIGLQYFLYDYLYLKVSIGFFTYPIDFVIRTLVVMVYNYISRKFLIYK